MPNRSKSKNDSIQKMLESEHFLVLNIKHYPHTPTSAEALVMPDSPHKEDTSCTCDTKRVPVDNFQGYPSKYMKAKLINENDDKNCDPVKRNILLIVKGKNRKFFKKVYRLKKVLITVAWTLKPGKCTTKIPSS